METKEIVAKEVERQAEFGYEPSWEDFVIAGIEAGVRKVVEFIDKEWDGTNEHRQAKLKEWGIS